MSLITVFTPTFNRAHLLPQLYASLCEQTLKNFTWLIIDDGSTDDTFNLVKKWKTESKINIEYHLQENQGMVAAHNTAHHLMNTTLCVCIDSDDYMPLDAIEKISILWHKYGSENCAGLIGLDQYPNGDIVGDKFPNDNWNCKFSDLEANAIYGDKKFVHNRTVFNKYLPYPKFEGEKFPITSFLYFYIEQDHRYLAFNEVLCVVEYQEDGLSNNLINQYKQSPKSFAHYRKTRMKFALNFKMKFKNATHYVSSMLMARNYRLFKENPAKLTTFFAIPFGVLLKLYLTTTKKTSINTKLNKK